MSHLPLFKLMKQSNCEPICKSFRIAGNDTLIRQNQIPVEAASQSVTLTEGLVIPVIVSANDRGGNFTFKFKRLDGKPR